MNKCHISCKHFPTLPLLPLHFQPHPQHPPVGGSPSWQHHTGRTSASLGNKLLPFLDRDSVDPPVQSVAEVNSQVSRVINRHHFLPQNAHRLCGCHLGLLQPTRPSAALEICGLAILFSTTYDSLRIPISFMIISKRPGSVCFFPPC